MRPALTRLTGLALSSALLFCRVGAAVTLASDIDPSALPPIDAATSSSRRTRMTRHSVAAV